MWNAIRSWFSSTSPTTVTDNNTGSPPALGWQAIDTAFRALYGVPELKHAAHNGVRAMHDLNRPPQYPLDGVSIWDGGSFWHYVGYGMTELYDKDNSNTAWSGWGYELTLRLAKTPGEEAPDFWAVDLLQKLAKAQWGRPPFEPGQTMTTGHLSAKTDKCGFLFAEDPGLGTIDTPHGKVVFLLLVAVDKETLQRAEGGNAAAVLASMREATGWVSKI